MISPFTPGQPFTEFHGKVKSRTLANLSMLPPRAIDVLRRTLKDGELMAAEHAFEIIEGVTCPLAARGRDRDGKSGKLQVKSRRP